MVMRVGGLATGMDIESMVNKLMEAERIPLTKMEQNRTELTWKRDAYRDLNRGLLELDELMNTMKRPSTYRSKLVTSSQEQSVTASSTSSASNGAYIIEVSQQASAATNDSQAKLSIDPDKSLKELGIEQELIKFSTVN